MLKGVTMLTTSLVTNVVLLLLLLTAYSRICQLEQRLFNEDRDEFLERYYGVYEYDESELN